MTAGISAMMVPVQGLESVATHGLESVPVHGLESVANCMMG